MNQLKASIRTSAEVRTVEFLRAGWQQVHAQIPCTSANTASVYIETILLPGGAVGKVYHIAKIDSNRFTTELRADFGFDVCLDFLKFTLKSQSNFEDSQKTIPIRKNYWVLGFLVQKWAIPHICRYAKNIPRKYHKQKESSVSGYRPLAFI